MSSAWIVFVGLGLAATSIFWFWLRADQTQDLGAVSHQWISEHRLANQDSRR